MKRKISVLGSGSWGTALAIHLAKQGHHIHLWGRDEETIKEIENAKENKKYLPGVKIPETIKAVTDIEEVAKVSDVIILSVASQGIRNVLQQIRGFVNPNTIIVNTAKGIEKKTLLPLSQVMKEELPNHTYVVLSGPSHAEEVSKGMPTTLVSSSEYKKAAELIQDLFMASNLRVYTNPDITGVELGGALKNIIALAAGVSDGLGFGDNSKAALMTRGIVEISRLGDEMGAHERTFSGLSGIGDLIVTCTSMHSRNRRCGILIGQGIQPDEAIKKIGMVVEGIYAVEAAYALSQKHGVEMPITEQLYHVLKSGSNVREAVVNLMTRQKKHEMEENANNDMWKY